MQPSLWTLQFLDLGSNLRPLHRLRRLNHWTVSGVPELPALKPTLPAPSKLGPARAPLSAWGAFPSCPVCEVGGPLAELPSNTS